MSNSKVTYAIEWYSSNINVYEKLAGKVESIIKELLNSSNINYYSVNSRAKSIESYKKKAIKENYRPHI